MSDDEVIRSVFCEFKFFDSFVFSSLDMTLKQKLVSTLLVKLVAVELPFEGTGLDLQTMTQFIITGASVLQIS